ncbi:MAG: GTP-binding protein [Candidatus Thermoplasmatota archaeon]|nr:GTP-binding protein [Candidatus Thermoplasmatota archaeon]
MRGKKSKRKVNLLGEAGVGKTSLTLRFVKDIFGEEYLKTIGTNIYTKEVPVTGSEVKLVIHDIMGDTDFDTVRETAFEKSTGAIAVADCMRKESLDKLIEDWLPKYKEAAVDNAPIILAVNKVDLEDHEITEEVVTDEAPFYFDSVFYTSAKMGKNVEDMFKELGFRAVYNKPSLARKGEDIVTMDKRIDDPRKLMSALLTYASTKGDMSYSTREEIFEQSGIDKFSLNEEMSEDNTLSFADGLIEWYEEDDDTESAKAVRNLLEKYEKES